MGVWEAIGRVWFARSAHGGRGTVALALGRYGQKADETKGDVFDLLGFIGNFWGIVARFLLSKSVYINIYAFFYQHVNSFYIYI
jgi:hypothetical protein